MGCGVRPEAAIGLSPVQRFETPPGHQGQVDFAEFRLPWGKRHALIVVLGYSRYMWLQYYERQTMTVVMRGLEAAFGYFGGVPSELRIPDHSDHRFRFIPITDSDGFRSLIPTDFDQ